MVAERRPDDESFEEYRRRLNLKEKFMRNRLRYGPRFEESLMNQIKIDETSKIINKN